MKSVAVGQDSMNYRNIFSQDWHLSFVLSCAKTSRLELSWDITYCVWMNLLSDLEDSHGTSSERQVGLRLLTSQGPSENLILQS